MSHPVSHRSVDSQWIVAKKDWKEAKKRSKEQEKRNDSKTRDDLHGTGNSSSNDYIGRESDDREPDTYHQDMDEMRCILYCHGGIFFLESS